MRSVRYIFSISLLVFTLAWSLKHVFAGFGNPQDPCFWLYKYQTLTGGWMTVGTLLTGGALVRLFGAHLLPLRIFGWLCTTAAVVLPYCAFQDREGRRSNLHWLAVAFGLMGYGAFQEFSPGTLSVLLLSALWVTSLRPLTPNPITLRLSPILLGLAIAVRFPNILALLVLLPLWKKRSLINIPVAALTAAIIYGLGALILTPAPVDPSMGSHGISEMIVKLWEGGGKVVGYALMWLGVLTLPALCSEAAAQLAAKLRINPSFLPLILGIAAGAALCYYVTFVPPIHQWYNFDLTYLISVGCIVMALFTRRQELLFGAAICMVATLGTDTAWLKLFPVSLCLLPVAAGACEPKMRMYLFPALIGLTAAAMMRFRINSIGDYNLGYADTPSAVAPYEGIRIRKVDERLLNQYKADYDSLKTDSTAILAVGREHHRMRAVTGCQAARYNEFWSNIFDSVYTAKYRDIIRAERPVVFCSFTPGFKTKPDYKDTQSAMENMLREEGYREIDRKKYKYMIYIPTSDNQQPTTDDPKVQ